MTGLVPLLETLGSSNIHDKEKAKNNWTATLKSLSPEALKSQIVEIEEKILKILEAERWQDREGGIFAITQVLCYLDLAAKENAEFKAEFFKRLKTLVKDKEYTIRVAVGECLKTLMEKYGPKIYGELQEVIEKTTEEAFVKEEVKDTLNKESRWQHLKSMLMMIKGCAEASKLEFLPYVNDKLVSLIEKAVKCESTFVRNLGISVITALLACLDEKALTNLSPRFVPLIWDGMNNDFSYIKHEGSLAARVFFTLIESNQELKKIYYPKLLPTIGLNRHYDLESISLIAKDIWENTIKGSNREWVINYLKNFVEYYLEQTKSEDDQVREASYKSIEELFTHTEVISKEKLKEFAKDILKILINGMEDKAWEAKTKANSAVKQLLLVIPLIKQ